MLLLLLLTLIAQTPNTGAEHALGEEEIIGEAELLITDPKPFYTPKLEPLAPLQDLLQSDSYVFDAALNRSMDSLTLPHRFIRSPYLRVPVQKSFVYGDIMTFLSAFDQGVADWEFLVSNSLGEAVRRAAGRGQPPYIIYWDGRTDRGEPIATGEIYSFTFKAADAQGNETRQQGMPQRVDAMVFRTGREATISIAADRIFRDGTSQLLADAGPRLDEAANIVRESFRREVTVHVYTEPERLSTDRYNTIRAELAKRLVLPEGALSVTPRFTPGLQPKSSLILISVR